MISLSGALSRFSALCLLLLVLFSCAERVSFDDAPVDVEALAPIAADLHLAESLTTEAPTLLRDSMREVYYSHVLEDHHITRQEFDSLMWIVRQEPRWLDSLYTRVGDILAQKAAEAL